MVGVEWVFGKRRSARPPTLSYRYWKAAREQARIDDFRFHDLRHSAASYLAMSGAGLLEIAEILGHKNIAQTQRYAHLSQGHLAEVVNRMAEQRFTT